MERGDVLILTLKGLFPFAKALNLSGDIKGEPRCAVTPSEVCRQPVLIQCATERHSSSALRPCAMTLEEEIPPTPPTLHLHETITCAF